MRRPVAIQLALFVITAVVALFVGTSYVLGPQTLRGSIAVSAVMDDAMNLGVGSSVTYRGVAVGSIVDISVAEAGSGADVAIRLDPDTKIPTGSTAKVTNNSALGIQSLDIMPTTSAGPYLTDGGTLDVPAELQPRQLDELLAQMSTLAGSIDPGSVTELGETLGTALDGTGPALQQFIDDADTLTRMLEARAPAIARILDSGLPMLDAVAAQSSSIEGSVGAIRDVTGQLVAQEPTLIYLLDRSPDALVRTQQLLDDTRGTVGALLTNSVTVSGVLGDRTPAMSALLVAMPETLAKLTSIVHGDRGDFTLVGAQGPVCWYDTPRRAVGDETPREPNLHLYCPPGADLAQRGSAAAPRPDDLGMSDARVPGNVTGPPIADDPVLIPTGVEALDYWKKLLEGVQK